MRVGLKLVNGTRFRETADALADFEAAGLALASVAESYSFDAVSQLGYLAATSRRVELVASILPIYSRTPALLAMTAAGLDYVSEGRFVLGLGASGPQVVEGLHGVPYDAPLARTRELIEICRSVWKRERLVHDGAHYTIPLPAGQGTGLGKPLKLIGTPVRERIPIHLAAIGPANVALAAELAEGWQPFLFYPEAAGEVWGPSLAKGNASRSVDLPPLDIVATAIVGFDEETAAAREKVRAQIALYVGGMGARGRNFYNDLAVRYSFADAAATIQDLYLAGQKDAAAAAVPEDFVRGVSLTGGEDDVSHRLQVMKDAGVTTVFVTPSTADHGVAVETVRRLVRLAAAV